MIPSIAITKHKGQFLQDFFVDTLLQKNNGFFVDIGCGTGDIDLKKYHYSGLSNTYALEKYKDWTGLGIDRDKKYYEAASPFRNKIICADLTKRNINEVLEENECPSKVDYLSVDVDDAQKIVLDDLDFGKYSFDIITYEHNYSVSQGSENLLFSDHREYSRKKFSKLGYRILIGNVGHETGSYIEDWHVSQELYDKYQHIAMEEATTRQIYRKLIKIKQER